MQILVMTPTIFQCIKDKEETDVIEKIINIAHQLDIKNIIILTEKEEKINLLKYNIDFKVIKTKDIFDTLIQITRNYTKLVLFILLHKGEYCLFNEYLKNKHAPQVCFLDITTDNSFDQDEYIQINDDDTDKNNSMLHSKKKAYKYRNLNKTSLPFFKVYKFPWIHIHQINIPS